MKPSFREILTLLNAHDVDYIVVGGVAAVVHGAPITTFDLDALVRVTDENARRLVAALGALDARFREHTHPIQPTEQDVLAGGHLLLMTRAGPLDILGFIGENQRYEDFEQSVVEVEMSRGRFRVLDLAELVRQKRATDRAKDRDMLEMLEQLLERRNQGAQ